MVSLFSPSFSNQGGDDPFYREGEASLSCKFPMWDCLPQRKKILSLKIWGLHLSLPCNFSMWDCLPQNKKILSLKIWGLQKRIRLLLLFFKCIILRQNSQL